MPQFNSAYTALTVRAQGASTTGFPNATDVQRERRMARDSYTTTGTEVNNDTILFRLNLPVGSIVNIEDCRLVFGAAGTFNASVTLQRVRAGVATSLSTALATTSAAVGVFARAAITPQTPSIAGDTFQLLITPFTSATVGKVIGLELAYDAPLL